MSWFRRARGYRPAAGLPRSTPSAVCRRVRLLPGTPASGTGSCLLEESPDVGGGRGDVLLGDGPRGVAVTPFDGRNDPVVLVIGVPQCRLHLRGLPDQVHQAHVHFDDQFRDRRGARYLRDQQVQPLVSEPVAEHGAGLGSALNNGALNNGALTNGARRNGDGRNGDGRNGGRSDRRPVSDRPLTRRVRQPRRRGERQQRVVEQVLVGLGGPVRRQHRGPGFQHHPEIERLVKLGAQCRGCPADVRSRRLRRHFPYVGAPVSPPADFEVPELGQRADGLTNRWPADAEPLRQLPFWQQPLAGQHDAELDQLQDLRKCLFKGIGHLQRTQLQALQYAVNAGVGNVCLTSPSGALLAPLAFSIKYRRSLPRPVHARLEHVGPRVVPGDIEHQPFFGNDVRVNVGDQHFLAADDGSGNPVAVRADDARAAVEELIGILGLDLVEHREVRGRVVERKQAARRHRVRPALLRYEPGDVAGETRPARPHRYVEVDALCVQREPGLRHPVLPADEAAEPQAAVAVRPQAVTVAPAPHQFLVVGRRKLAVHAYDALAGIDGGHRAVHGAGGTAVTPLGYAEEDEDAQVRRCFADELELRAVGLHGRLDVQRVRVFLGRIVERGAVRPADPEWVPGQKRFREHRDVGAALAALLEELYYLGRRGFLVEPDRPGLDDCDLHRHLCVSCPHWQGCALLSTSRNIPGAPSRSRAGGTGRSRSL